MSLDEVRVNKKELLEILTANLAKHRGEYETALMGWRKRVIAKMKENLALAEAGKEPALYIDIPSPMDHRKDYERVIEMVRASIEDSIELTGRQFESFWLDEWGWMPSFRETVTAYS